MSDLILRFVCALFIAIASGYFFHKRGLRYLQYLQQEDYDGARFWTWCQEKHAFDRRGTVIAFFGGIICGIFTGLNVNAGAMLAVLVSYPLFTLARREEDPTKTGKVTLKLTERAQRIFGTAESLYGLILFALLAVSTLAMGKIGIPFMWLSQVVLFQLQPVILIAAKVLLDPQEEEIQKNLANEARAILSQVNPLVIGITGSYGKTSTKFILSDILSAAAPTFTTPRSINSYMGMTREIRERLNSRHRYAVVEMGAYHVGSIKKMCGLVPPRVGVVTAVGPMHLERFGSEENIFKAKSELPQAVPDDGILVCNGDYDWCRRMASENPKRTTLLYGLDRTKGPLDSLLFDIETTAKGSKFKISFAGNEYSGFTKLLGKPMLSNILAAFTTACSLGVAPEVALAAVFNVKTEANRLEPVKTNLAGLSPLVNGQKGDSAIVRLNDAFNSNPVGFRSALEVLKELPGKRKILVTPGMVELGERQASENESAGEAAAAVCDFVVVVGDTNKEALLKGLESGGLTQGNIEFRPNMKDALAYLAADYCADGDIVLIENDLPDLYETRPVF
jgi:UDP-N-acetylmuramoyl-tripeptide--D-alanyl-D-alanine ligase